MEQEKVTEMKEKETVEKLEPEDLEQVTGGGRPGHHGDSCNDPTFNPFGTGLSLENPREIICNGRPGHHEDPRG